MTSNNRLTDFMAELDREEAVQRSEAVRAIKYYDTERSNESTAKVAKDTAGVVLRNWLMTHADEGELVDQEWGLRAYLQNGGKTRWYDAPSMVKAENPKLYARLESLGLFRLDDEAVQKALAEGWLTHGDIAGYAHEGERAQSLQVKKVGK